MSEALEAWARRVLADTPGLPPLRLRHSAGVARRAAGAGAALLPPADADLVRSAAWLHDVGYAPGLVDTGCHAIDGARHLQRLGAPGALVGLVAYHSGSVYEAAQRGVEEELAEFPRPRESLLDLLTFADMTVDDEGCETTIENRLTGIFERYAFDDAVHVSVYAARLHLTSAVRRVQHRMGDIPIQAGD